MREGADCMFNFRFFSQVAGEMDGIRIIQVGNILGEEDKEFNVERYAFGLFV